MAKFAEQQIKTLVANKLEQATDTSKESTSKENNTKKEVKSVESNTKKNGILDGDDPLMEIIELTGENSGDKKDSKRGENVYMLTFNI